MAEWIRWFEEISSRDVELVGGKTASLGEMYRNLAPQGIKVPPGFGITAQAYQHLIERSGLQSRIQKLFQGSAALSVAELSSRCAEARQALAQAGLPSELKAEVISAYRELSRRAGVDRLDVAVRSSATAEDLPTASFAGQHESFLNMVGEEQVLEAVLHCFSSLYTPRAVSYRNEQGFLHSSVHLSVAVQQMVRADTGSAGIMFTIDTESGHRDMLLITSAYGLGENIVAGKVSPDEFLVSKTLLRKGKQAIVRRTVGAKQLRMIYSAAASGRVENIEVPIADQQRLSLSSDQVLQLARWGLEIEEHYSQLSGQPTPMDIEWGLDGRSGELFILQARPETVQARKPTNQITVVSLEKRSKALLEGRAVGASVGTGPVRIVAGEHDMHDFCEGDILVADMTTPGWEPVLKKAAAVVTNRGGRTCHAAIVSRELGIPCVVGTGQATEVLKSGQAVTVSCAEGDRGVVYEGILPFTSRHIDLSKLAKPQTQIYLNVGDPEQALSASLLPVQGVGLARMEFIISNHIRVHPMALLKLDEVPKEAREEIEALTQGYSDKARYFVDKLAEGIGLIAAAFYPRPIIVRFSDFKSNEYASLLGGRTFEPTEENPMLGWRGAVRYYHPNYRDAFALECQALKYAREEQGLTNIKAMIPFCRTLGEAKSVLVEMEKSGLRRGDDGFEVYLMCEIPSNVVLARKFAELVDGFSIGSNDLTQLTLGLDRDSELVSALFDERDPAVTHMLERAVKDVKAAGKKIGICGQAPSDYPEVARFLVECGIDSISLSPDAVFKTTQMVLEAEETARPKLQKAG